MTISSDYAAYLKAAGLFVMAKTANAAAWADGATLLRDSPAATIEGGQREGARQVAFLGGALVRDVGVVPGRKAYLLGRPIIGRHAELGYAAGVPAFVIGAEERADGTTALTILRKLA